MLVLGSVFASGVASALMVDQSQPNTSVRQSGVNDSSGKLQSFQPTASNVAGGGFYFSDLFKDSAGATIPIDMRIALWNGLPGSGAEIASATVELSAIGWLEAFWAPTSVTAGQTYYLAVTTGDVPVGGQSEPVVTSGGPANLYANGRPYAFNPTTLVIDNIGCCFEAFDYSFRTYYADTVAPVPLPAAAWLLLSGLAGLGVLGRRRNAA